MTDFEKTCFRHCFDIIHGAIGVLRTTMDECGGPGAVRDAKLLEYEVFSRLLKIRKLNEIPYHATGGVNETQESDDPFC